MPTNVWLATGIRIEIDGKDANLSAPFTRCGPAGCFAEIGLNDDAQKKFRTVTEPGQILYEGLCLATCRASLFKGFGRRLRCSIAKLISGSLRLMRTFCSWAVGAEA